MRFLRLFLLLFVVTATAQQGGMWVPSLLSGRNEAEMKKLGSKITAQQIYDANKPGIKDAVPQFDGGCTAEMISPKGLLLTNHHCGFSEIQSHSTVEHDYLTDGFWAMSMEEELPNPGVVVTFVVKIADVTDKVLAGVASLETEAEKQKKIQENITSTQKSYPKESWQENKIRNFFDGNQYLLFVTETFKDIRLVGAPPSSIGKFGSDTDNWVWPRHTGDFSLFRVYADKNNRPAEYSKNNVPYKPKHYFPVSIAGIRENDFTMVMGYPGRTTEYLPAVAVEQIVNDLDPARIGIREVALKVQDGFMRQDKAIKIQYAAKYASVANYWKKWIGEVKGLKKSNAIGIKRDQEKSFMDKVAKAGKQSEYGHLLSDFEKEYAAIAPYALGRDYFQETFLRNTELTQVGYQLVQLSQIHKTRGEQSFNDRKANLIKNFEGFYKDFNKTVDQKVFESLIAHYAKNAPAQFVPASLKSADAAQLASQVYGSAFTSYDGLKNLLSGDATSVLKKLDADPGFQFMQQMAKVYQEDIAPKYDEINLRITGLQRTYMKAILEMNPGERIFPDANSTLRVTYGKVKGYNPADAVTYSPVTYLDGVMEKYIPGDYEFDVPQKLIDLYNKKDFGQYADNGRMPVNFIGTNHTTGGNSGSPALDANGNLIGLNFDRVWEGTMSDIHYDPEICRNIMVDMRYVLFIIDKFAGAKHLIDEMSVVKTRK
jgi:hypothetical protein